MGTSYPDPASAERIADKQKTKAGFLAALRSRLRGWGRRAPSSALSAAAPRPALAPGRSPIPSRLTSSRPRPCGRPTPAERGRIDLRAAESQPTDAARIAERTSATAVPGTCREGGSRSGTGVQHASRGAVTRQGAALAASPQGLTATAADNPSSSAGVDAVHPADIAAPVAVDVRAAADAATATNPSSLAASPTKRARRAFGARAFASSTAIGLALLFIGLGAPSAQAGCPNEQLRQESNINPFTLQPFSTQLPDCRAYEMVTPAFKDGFQTEDVGGLSADGSRRLVETGGTFAGVKSNVLGGSYLLSRSPTGWSATAISPPASSFPATTFMASDTNIGRTLWALRTAAQSLYVQDLYLREEDGTFVKIGPMVPPSASGGPPAGAFPVLSNAQYKFAGASNDLSHVLFQARNEPVGKVPGFVWPGDTTTGPTTFPGGISLYEYVGTGNARPALVGVSDGSTMLGAEQLPAGRLISDCSTFLGSERSGQSFDVYNAISGDGSTVYFTATGHDRGGSCTSPHAPDVTELYARVNGSETVPISEPTSAQCAACLTAVRAPAEFRGASRDGSQAFFLTEQELLPGATGTNLYAYDFNGPAGQKIIRVSTGSPAPEVQGVARVSQDGSHVYFVAKGVLTTGSNGEGNTPVAGGFNLYLFERDAAHPAGRVSFIATLSQGDEAQVWGARDTRPVQATPDGRYLVFTSVADLTPGDTSEQRQVFEYDAVSEELVRVSIGQAGYPEGMESADANPSAIAKKNYSIPGGFGPAEATSKLAVSDDGRVVVFNSTGALAAGAVVASAAGAPSVYEYRSAGALSDGNVFLVSDGSEVVSNFAPANTSTTGADVFFQTADPLLASDGDSQFDLYDAREGGGFAAAAAPALCTGDACQGTSSGPPTVPTLPNFAGPPNPTPPKPCAKGKVRKGGKCVKKASKKHHHNKSHQKNKRTASNNAGGNK